MGSIFCTGGNRQTLSATTSGATAQTIASLLDQQGSRTTEIDAHALESCRIAATATRSATDAMPPVVEGKYYGNLVQADVHTVKFRDSLADCRRKLRTMTSYAINR